MIARARVFVCSPYRGAINKTAGVLRARSLCDLMTAAGRAPFAPHLFCPQFLDDADEAQRAAGIEIGLSFMEVCEEVLAYTEEGVSEGMKAEIRHARALGKPIRWIGPEWTEPT